MNQVKELVKEIDSIWEHLKISQSDTILRDFCDDPTDQPYAFTILGKNYEWGGAEIIGKNLIAEDDQIEIILASDDDLSVFLTRVYRFPVTVEVLEDYRDALKEYYNEYKNENEEEL